MGVVTLEPDLGIERCEALKATLAAAAGPLRVDGGAVERVHAAGLQVLVAWRLARDAAGQDTAWSACSPALRAAARTLGLEAALGLADAPEHRQPVENAA